MVLVIGGVSAGKCGYVKERFGHIDSDIVWAVLDGRPVVADVQELVREHSAETLLPRLLEKQVVICNEVGAGVVPLDAADRDFREEVGRLCCMLAERADMVVRVFCGIPTVLKGDK